MIEYKYKHKEWRPLKHRHIKRQLAQLINPLDFELTFEDYIIRVNGTEYTENSLEVVDAILKDVAWGNLKND